MRCLPVLILSVPLAACVSTGEQTPPIPPANLASMQAATAPAGAYTRRVVYDGAGKYILPDGKTTATADPSGGFVLPNGVLVPPDGIGGIILPNGAKCVSDGARGYLCP